jgi:hypothetical protein
MELVVHTVGGLLVVLIPTVLSIYKPKGLTPFGLRKQQEQRTLLQQSPPSPQRASGSVGISSGGTITITLRRTQILAFATVILVLHILILHLIKAGLMEH